MPNRSQPFASEPAGAYGSRLSDIFRLDSAPTFINRNLQSGLLAVTEIRDDAPTFQVSDPLVLEDAFLAIFHPRAFVDGTAWEKGRRVARYDIPQGATVIRDLKRDPMVLIDQPHHSLHFYIPRAALDLICDDSGAERIGDLRYDPAMPFDDAVLASIAGAVIAALAIPAAVNQLFLDHVTMAVGTHIAQTYGGLVPGSRIARGGLSPHQERRAKELIDAHLDGLVSIDAIATACGLSTSHFRRAFRQSTGLAPHQWLLARRVDAAKASLADPALSLPAVARRCGFADQSHFTRVFVQLEGVTPGRWRREHDIRSVH